MLWVQKVSKQRDLLSLMILHHQAIDILMPPELGGRKLIDDLTAQ